MGRQVRVPIRVKQRNEKSERVLTEESQAVVEPEPPVVEEREVNERRSVDESAAGRTARQVPAPRRAEAQETERLQEELETWRDRALRLQAEMENFRKRQQRLANDQTEANRARLLRSVLTVADNLELALRAEGDEESLREGVAITARSLEQILSQEGVEQIQAEGQTFDPKWHEAVGMVPHRGTAADEDTVVEVIREGYRLDGRLLRPARVIVAK